MASERIRALAARVATLPALLLTVADRRPVAIEDAIALAFVATRWPVFSTLLDLSR